ncbi:MAG: arginine deiminase family protein [Caldisphaeraceae archaeon]|nr:arginine deiminase family protein [Caldisphaeraceae archaeon]
MCMVIYINSEVGRLREVLMHVPGKELDLITEDNYRTYLFSSTVDKEKFKEEVLDLMEVYKNEGIKISLIKGLEDKPNGVYARDPFIMTPQGFILSSFRHDIRKGEEVEYEKALSELNYPILKKMGNDEIFEGGNAIILNSETALIGIGERTNRNGINAFTEALTSSGFKNIFAIQTPLNRIHIDEYVSQINEDTIITVKDLFPFEVAERLKDLGFNIITLDYKDVSGDMKRRLCLNFVTIEPNKVVVGEGCDAVKKVLEENAVDAITVEIDEMVKGGGGIHCVTGQLVRDPI